MAILEGNPKLIMALGKALQLTITIHEVDKVYRRTAKRWGYKKLRKWFDFAADQSGDWRWCLEGLLAKYGKPINVMLNATIVDTTDSMIDFINNQLQNVVSVRQLYQDAYNIAEQVNDNTAASKLCDLQECAECIINRLEGFARQINDMGAAEWLGQKL